MDLIIVGSGLSGAVLANRFANSNKKVLILEKRNHLGGNIFDEKINNIWVQKYGPHIFHTNNEEVMLFMKPFMELNSFRNKVAVKIDNKEIPLPFNFTGIDTFWPNEAEEIKKELINKYQENTKVPIYKLKDDDHPLVKEVYDFIFNNIFKNYTEKMWGVPIEELSEEVLSRVPITIGYEDRYFSDKYEGVPKGGFSSVINKLLDHENIRTLLNTNANDVLIKKEDGLYYEGQKVTVPIIYTGSLDEFLDYKYGDLKYRSLNIEFETINSDSFQNNGVINYPSHPTMTRISEYKKLYLQNNVSNTIISKEYPGDWDKNSTKFSEPYYPIVFSDKDKEIYNKYLDIAIKQYNLIPLGRLAEYKYLNMDQAISNALDLAERLLGE